MNKKLIFACIIVLQLVFLAGMVIFYHARISRATRILLQTEPVDPFSVFRGRYISLNYRISTLQAALVKDGSPRDLKSGNSLYVLLEKKGAFWEPVAAYKNRPSDKGGIYLKGRIIYISPENIRVTYGIESFFLSEKSADEIEHRRGSRNWSQIQKQREERIGGLNEETRRIYSAGITDWWKEKLDGELEYWLKEGIVNQEQVTKIRAKYTEALTSIKEVSREVQTGITLEEALTVEVAVTEGGTSYPVRIFWKGKEYR